MFTDDELVFEKRSLWFGGKDTTISIERLYWVAIDTMAKCRRTSWRGIVRDALSAMPGNYHSRAGWLRIYVTAFAYAFLPRPAKRTMPHLVMGNWWWGRWLRDNAKEIADKSLAQEWRHPAHHWWREK